LDATFNKPNDALSPEFFNGPADDIALQLLGKALVRRINRQVVSYKITETEAYMGPHDLACHASKGKTRRTEIMFGPPGTFYVYFIYGMYWMLNIVTGEIGHPAAVLIRAIEGISGPGRLTRALGITGSLNGKRASRRTGLWVSDRGYTPDPGEVVRTARIGVAYAGPLWAAKEYRFVLKGHGVACRHQR
jgi:DNA-3-methyladenine glycosylase